MTRVPSTLSKNSYKRRLGARGKEEFEESEAVRIVFVTSPSYYQPEALARNDFEHVLSQCHPTERLADASARCHKPFRY